MIEARIIETTKNFSRDLGINWGFNAIADAAHGNTTGLVFPNNGTSAADRQPAPATAPTARSNLKLGNVLNTFTLDVAAAGGGERGPDQHPLGAQGGDAQQPAGLHPERPADPGADRRQQHGDRAVRQRHAAARRHPAGDRRGHRADGHRHLEARAARPPCWSPAPPTPRSPPRTRSTRLVVRDGGTAVIGGIYKITSNDSEDRVPGLANLPIIGHLFKNKSRTRSTTSC